MLYDFSGVFFFLRELFADGDFCKIGIYSVVVCECKRKFSAVFSKSAYGYDERHFVFVLDDFRFIGCGGADEYVNEFKAFNVIDDVVVAGIGYEYIKAGLMG